MTDLRRPAAVRITVVDRAGEEHACNFPAGGSLMEALRDGNFDVAAICGGMCSCATCHVYVAEEWAGRLPPREDDEQDLVSELEHCRESSRLSCQIALTEELEGLCVTLAPEE